MLTGYPAAIAVLAVYWLVAVTSIMHKSATSDEIVHIPAGYSYWKYNDYRMDPENGNLPQRWMALPLLFGQVRFPDRNQPAWRTGREWQIGREFFFYDGNDTGAILWRSRAMIALLGVTLGILIYGWSRRLFGPIGGMISLLLFAFDPTMLANGRLATSDMAAGLFFVLSTGSLWLVIHKLTPARLALSCLAMGGLFLAKMSGVLAIPLGLILIAAKLAGGKVLIVTLGGKVRQISRRLDQAAVLTAVVVVHAIAVIVIIWGAYGFRFSMFSPRFDPGATQAASWDELTAAGGPINSVLLAARDHELLPEGYLYGFAHVYKYSRMRSAFMMGHYSLSGWKLFFPLSFAIKTPLATLATLALALAALLAWVLRAGPGRRWSTMLAGIYRATPLLAVLVVCWLVVITSHLNIGHRHLLPIYPPLFIIAGGACLWLRSRLKWPRFAVGALLVALVIESAITWPNYLAYFNLAIGGPANGYKYLVDSSLDWGQDVPGLKKWIDRNAGAQPVYVSYFGNNILQKYGIDAIRLAGYPDWGRDNNAPAMVGGVYCVSATTLQTVLTKPWGPWSRRYEAAYTRILKDIPQLRRTMFDPAGREAFVKSITDTKLIAMISLFDELQFARLAAFLRQRQPDDYIGYSILVYRLSDSDVRRALAGPPPELKATPQVRRPG